MDYTPGKGGGIVPVVTGSGAATAAVAELPKTGITLVNEVAISIALGLVAWAVAYKLMNKSA